MEVMFLDDNILGRRMKRLRERKDLKQNRVADALSVSPFQLSRYESGKSKPDPELIVKISNYYDVDTDYLLGVSDIPNKVDKDEEEFQAFSNDPELQRWYKELPENDEEDLQKLRQMWDIIKGDKNNRN